MNTDLASVVVGAIAIGAAIGARWIVQAVCATPRERAELRRAKWKRKSEAKDDGRRVAQSVER